MLFDALVSQCGVSAESGGELRISGRRFFKNAENLQAQQ